MTAVSKGCPEIYGSPVQCNSTGCFILLWRVLFQSLPWFKSIRLWQRDKNLFLLQVFPDLRAWCEQRRLHLVECDLRWVSLSDLSKFCCEETEFRQVWSVCVIISPRQHSPFVHHPQFNYSVILMVLYVVLYSVVAANVPWTWTDYSEVSHVSEESGSGKVLFPGVLFMIQRFYTIEYGHM